MRILLLGPMLLLALVTNMAIGQPCEQVTLATLQTWTPLSLDRAPRGAREGEPEGNFRKIPEGLVGKRVALTVREPGQTVVYYVVGNVVSQPILQSFDFHIGYPVHKGPFVIQISLGEKTVELSHVQEIRVEPVAVDGEIFQ